MTLSLPKGIDSGTAGPLFCGGIAVFNPLHQFSIPPTASVGILGIGGLGHLALQFCRAWGCEVTAMTSTETKREEAAHFGAHDVIISSHATAIEDAAGRFDLLISTLPVGFDTSSLLKTLRPGGRLHVLGVMTEPLELDAVTMLFGQHSVSSSPVGSPLAIATMLRFAERRGIPSMRWLYWLPTVGTFAMLVFGYCLLARFLVLLPWNRDEPMSFDLLSRAFFSRPRLPQNSKERKQRMRRRRMYD